MANKVIVKNKKVEEVNDKDGVELRRLNAVLKHEDISEDELAHFGVMGMKWGVRRGSSDSSSSGSKGKSVIKKLVDADKKVDRDFAEAGKTVSPAKKALIGAALGPYWGAKALNRMDSKAPEKALKNEMKNASKTILKNYDKKVYGKDGVVARVNKANPGKGKAEAKKWYEQLAKESEKAFNDSVKETLGSSNKFKVVITEKQTGDLAPDFKLVLDNS